VPRSLTPQQVHAFRDALCNVATRHFAEHGYAGVTLRGLAREVGCSPMTPYRYFEDKDAIFAAVRAAAFGRFADASEQAASREREPLARLAALGRAYLRFALDEPHAYRIMFELSQPDELEYPELAKQAERARGVKLRAVREAIEAGLIEGDATLVANLLWSGMHGGIVLHLAGKLHGRPELEPLCEAMMNTMIRGLRPGAKQENPR
jgi:AcrR family transcriptional regulator